MNTLYRIFCRFLPRHLREEFGEEMARDLAFHLEEAPGSWSRIRILVRATIDVVLTGLAARRTPRRRPRRGNGGGLSLSSLTRDLWYGGRVLRKDSGFTLVAVFTLALGIGGAILSFSLVNGVLLRPLPFPADRELVTLKEQWATGAPGNVSFPNFDDWRTEAHSFQGMTALRFPSDQTILAARESFRGTIVPVSREFFQVLGVNPWLGRPILPNENRPGGQNVAVVGYEFWSSALGSQVNLETLSLTLGAETFDVVGVMPPGFRVHEKADVYLPLEQNAFQVRNSLNYRVVGRLAPGATLTQARAEMDVLTRRIREAHPDDARTVSVPLRLLREEILGEATRPLWLLLGASTLLLLLACTNVAGMLLARGTRRERELAIRTALGAGRSRLVQLLLAESLLLAAAAGGLGVGFARLTLGFLRSRGADLIPRLGTVTLDPTGLVFAVSATVLTAVAFGLLPALRMSRGRDGLRSGPRGDSRETGALGWNFLVGGQAALAVLLVVASGLLIRSLAEILSADTHFRADGVLTVEMDFSATGFTSAQERGVLVREIKDAFSALPGVDGVGLVSYLPDQGNMMIGGVYIPPLPVSGPPDPLADAVGWRVVDEDYFRVMRIPVLEGRTFSPEDAADAPPVIVLNEPVARILFGEEEAVGRMVQFSPFWEDAEQEVVGVVAEARDWRRAPGEQREGYVFWPQRLGYAWVLTAVLHTESDPAALARPARARLRALAPTVPGTVQTLESRVAESFRDRSFTLGVLGAFAILSLLLAAVGIYGVVGYTVSARSREVGIRLALGAETGDLRWTIFLHSAWRVAVGAGVGVVASLPLGGIMGSLLFGVSPHDPAVLATAPLVLLAAATVAIWIPVLHHTRVDPVVTMRAE